jgi:hypothetical protein
VVSEIGMHRCRFEHQCTRPPPSAAMMRSASPRSSGPMLDIS